MFIGVMQIELVVPGAVSLKDKRRVVKSLKDRLHREHLVSVAEVGALEHHRLALLGVSAVSNSASHASAVLDRVERKARSLGDAEVRWASRDVVTESSIGSGVFEETGEPLWRPDESREAAAP